MTGASKTATKDRLLEAGRKGIALELERQAAVWMQKTNRLHLQMLQPWELRRLECDRNFPHLREWREDSSQRSRRWQAACSLAVGLLSGGLLCVLVVVGLLPSEPQEVTVSEQFEPEPEPEPESCRNFRHRVEHGDSWEILANMYGIPAEDIASHNDSSLGEAPLDGTVLEVCSNKSVENREARKIRVPASIEVPEGEDPSITLGAPNRGQLINAVALPEANYYDLRCSGTAYSTKDVADRLGRSLALLRKRYRGQIIVADISLKSGGDFRPHASHQSGRDVDIWLPIVGGRYAVSERCRRCGTPWCRPDTAEIDWEATWLLLQALVAPELGAEPAHKRKPSVGVSEIFLDLDVDSREQIRRAALETVEEDEYKRIIGKVTDNERHKVHMHVRFACPLTDSDCINRSVK
ncbi:MAG: penicillin-insensitive murein endopeptidase [Nannocystaceae bacterium]